MSVWQQTYVARIAPASYWASGAIRHGIHVDEDGERMTESFERDAFTGTDPRAVPVILRHDTSQVVGRLTQLARSGRWHVAAFELDPEQPLAVAAADLLHVGAPVSIGFDELRRNRSLAEANVRQVTAARLNELSILGSGDRPVYPGACVVAVVPHVQRTPATSTRHAHGARMTRDFGEIIAVR